MPIITLHNINHAIGNRCLFQNLSLSIEKGERVALVGFNGSGKTTLLRILSGEIEPNSGNIVRAANLRVSVVQQFLPKSHTNLELFDFLAEAIPGGYQGISSDYIIEQTLELLQLPECCQFSRLGELSGGELNRAFLAHALIETPDLLLLDEPTNHMDIEAMKNFETLIQNQAKCAVCLVSHDRTVLDSLTERTVFLRDKKAYYFDLSYSTARKALRAADEAAARKRQSEERELDRLRTSAKKMAEWGHVFDNEKFSRRAKSMQKKIEKQESLVSFVTTARKAQVKIEAGCSEVRTLMRIEDFTVRTPDDRMLFKIQELRIQRGDRIAILGPNGSGKSTFVRAIVETYNCKQKSITSRVHLSPQLKLGYYEQDLSQMFAPTRIIDFLVQKSDIPERILIPELVRSGFPYARHIQRLSELSGGVKWW